MKARIIAIIAGVCILIGVASAAGKVSDGNSLVSKNYLYEVFFPQLKEHIAEYAADKWENVFGQSTDRMDQVGQEHMNALSPYAGEQWLVAERPEANIGSTGGSIRLAVGSGIEWTSGEAVFTGNASDITAGTAIQAGDTLIPGHHYIVASESDIFLRSDSQWQVEGKWLYTPPVG